MSVFAPFRQRVPAAAAAVLALTVTASAVAMQPSRGGFGGRVSTVSQMRSGPARGAARPPQQPKQEHLSQWMQRHSNLSPEEQQKALEKEPGFRDLPPETQQHVRDSLNKLNSMPPDQRSRYLARTEAMERLNPDQRKQVRDAMGQLGSLPTDRRRQVARAFRQLQQMPESQRQATLNSPQFRGQFSDQERGTISNLLAIEPYGVLQPNDKP